MIAPYGLSEPGTELVERVGDDGVGREMVCGDVLAMGAYFELGWRLREFKVHDRPSRLMTIDISTISLSSGYRHSLIFSVWFMSSTGVTRYLV